MNKSSKFLLVKEVAGLIDDFTKRKEISNNDLAKRLEISAATLSNIVNLKSEKLNESLLNRIKSSLKPDNGWVLVKTSNFVTIHQNCNTARSMRRMFGIVGCTGAGKTTALERYYNENPETYLVICKKTMSPKQFFISLLREIGVHFTGSIYEIIERIALELNSKNNPLVIIDEAGKMSQTILLYLHDLRDSTLQTTGIVLAGVEYFKANLEKAVDKQKEGMPELYDRIGFWQELGNASKKEKEAICEHNGVKDSQFIKEVVKGSKNYRQVFQLVQNIKTQLV